MISKPDEPFKLNILFVDEEGNEIQASCPPKFSRWFRPILQVGQIVIVAPSKGIGSEIDVVLWPPFDDKIDDATIIHEVEMGRFIIVMKGLSVKSYNNELRLSTTAGTILAVNEAISIFQDYDDIFKPSSIVVNDFRTEDANAAIKVVDERTIGELLDMNPIYKIALDVEDEIGSTTFILFENSAIQLFKFPASKYRSGNDQHIVPIYMKKQVQNLKKVFHVSLAINDDRFRGGCFFVVGKVFDYDVVNANSTISEVVGPKVKLLLSPSPSNLMQSSRLELEDDISLEKKSQSYVKRKYCVIDDEVDSESETLKTKKVVDGAPSMN
ncbi:hypothetical protein ACFE04_004249 [Oxalis oulophora]